MFFRNYHDASRNFTNACGNAGLPLSEYTHPLSPLTTSVARLGALDAKKTLIVISGTHGVEGFLGSACQSKWLRDFGSMTMPTDCAIYLIHALNPWGMKYLRRVDHENIDVNRNFLDQWNHLPKNKGYDEFAWDIECNGFTEEQYRGPGTNLYKLNKIFGADVVLRMIAPGQYTRPHGLFFGGRAPSWSHKTLRSFLKQNLKAAEHIAVMDFHTGIGAFAALELICPWTKTSDEFLRARSWYHEYNVVSPLTDDSLAPMVSGDLLTAIARLLPGRPVTAVAAEFGTYDAENLLTVLVWENLLHNLSRIQGKGRSIGEEEQKLLNHFTPDDKEWQEVCTNKGVSILNAAINGLAAL